MRRTKGCCTLKTCWKCTKKCSCKATRDMQETTCMGCMLCKAGRRSWTMPNTSGMKCTACMEWKRRTSRTRKCTAMRKIEIGIGRRKKSRGSRCKGLWQTAGKRYTTWTRVQSSETRKERRQWPRRPGRRRLKVLQGLAWIHHRHRQTSLPTRLKCLLMQRPPRWQRLEPSVHVGAA
jgi:hypothetical protein